MTSHKPDTAGTGLNLGDGLEHSLVRLEEEGLCKERLQNRVMIDLLPDNALLETFHFFKDDPRSSDNLTWSWVTLIHVCRRWRHIIFESPRRLDLRLVCSHKTPVRKLLDIWPPFPIFIDSVIDRTVDEECSENIVAALERRERISFIHIHDDTSGSALKKSIAAMDEPFPVLTLCKLISRNKSVLMPILQETFLGGSAPDADTFELRGIPFPTFPTFVLSSTQIRFLFLEDIPNSGHISPQVMATCLATLPNLRHLSIGFQSPLSRPVEMTAPPFTRSVFPQVISLSFSGASEYFEDFVARIDAPRLSMLTVTFFMDLIFNIRRLHDFINRTLTEKPNQASMWFTGVITTIIFETETLQTRFELGIKCDRLDWQLSSMTQIFSQQLHLLSHVERFEIREPRNTRIGWEDDPNMDTSQWLELFRLLTSVESLYVSERLVHRVAAALNELTGEMAMEILPALRNLSFRGLQPSGPVQDVIEPFVTARHLTNQHVVVQPWEH